VLVAVVDAAVLVVALLLLLMVVELDEAVLEVVLPRPIGKAQAPSEHVSFDGHAAQSPPAAPQVSFETDSQTPLVEQQPPQFDGLHGELHPVAIAAINNPSTCRPRILSSRANPEATLADWRHR
jgi:hypothetical protein